MSLAIAATTRPYRIRTLEFSPLGQRLWLHYDDGSVAFIEPAAMFEVDRDVLGAWLSALVLALAPRELIDVRLPLKLHAVKASCGCESVL